MARRRHISEEDSSRVYQEFIHATDRAAGISLVSVVEMLLQEAIAYALPNAQTATEFERIFGQYKPLSSLSAKIDIAYAIGIIDNKMRANLHHVRNIRNTFAHDFSLLQFDKEPIRGLVKKIDFTSADIRAKDIQPLPLMSTERVKFYRFIVEASFDFIQISYRDRVQVVSIISDN